MNTEQGGIAAYLRAAESASSNLEVLEMDERLLSLQNAIGFVVEAARVALAAAPPPASAAPGWVHLPKRDTALNLARVSRVEFFGTEADDAMLFFDHAESADAEQPGFVTTAYLPVAGPDTAAIRAALALPAPAAAVE